jgi:hypothetical protein
LTGTYPKRGIIPVAEAQELNSKGTGDTKHSPTAVDDLGLLEALEGSRVLGKTKRVEAVVPAKHVRQLICCADVHARLGSGGSHALGN